MKRCLFNILAGLSLLMCVGTGVLWTMSFWVSDARLVGDGANRWAIQSYDGAIHVINVPDVPSPQNLNNSSNSHICVCTFPPRPPTFLGIGFSITPGNRFLAIPYWLIQSLTLVVPAVWFRRYRLHRITQFRRSHGLCTICGYDLRGTPDRCPECGTPVRAGAKA